MDNVKIGKLIYQLRKENRMTQLQLANQMNISDKAVSKWERGLGCPELSLLPELSKIFNVDLEKLLSFYVKDVSRSQELKEKIQKLVHEKLLTGSAEDTEDWMKNIS